MPKVLRILNRFNLGGPTYNAAYLSKYMSPDFETLLIGGANSKTEKNSEYIVRDLGLEPLIIPEMKREINPINDFIAFQKIKKIIRDFKPDIVHTHASKAGALGRRAAFSEKVPVILHTFHGHVFDSYFNNYISGFYKNLERKLAEKSTQIIAVSDLQKEELSNKFEICSAEKITVIPLGFDLQRFYDDMDKKRIDFRKKYLIDDDEIAIGIIGRVVPIKNHSLFLKSIKYILENSSKKIRAFIIGDGESRKATEEEAKSLNIDFITENEIGRKSTLTFTSWIQEIDHVMAGLDIVALTSLNEGTPVSLIEAKAANKPIVTTNAGGIRNFLEHNKSALLSEINDEPAFMKNLLLLVENEIYRQTIANCGSELIKEKFHYTRLVNDMTCLYNRLLNRQ